MWDALLLPPGGSSSCSSSPVFVTKGVSKVLPQPRGWPVTGVEIIHWLLLTLCVIFNSFLQILELGALHFHCFSSSPTPSARKQNQNERGGSLPYHEQVGKGLRPAAVRVPCCPPAAAHPQVGRPGPACTAVCVWTRWGIGQAALLLGGQSCCRERGEPLGHWSGCQPVTCHDFEFN